MENNIETAKTYMKKHLDIYEDDLDKLIIYAENVTPTAFVEYANKVIIDELNKVVDTIGSSALKIILSNKINELIKEKK